MLFGLGISPPVRFSSCSYGQFSSICFVGSSSAHPTHLGLLPALSAAFYTHFLDRYGIRILQMLAIPKSRSTAQNTLPNFRPESLQPSGHYVPKIYPALHVQTEFVHSSCVPIFRPRTLHPPVLLAIQTPRHLTSIWLVSLVFSIHIWIYCLPKNYVVNALIPLESLA